MPAVVGSIKDGPRHRIRGMSARGEDARSRANGYPRKTTVENFIRLADAPLQEADIFAQISADDVIRLLREGVDAIS